MEFRELATGLKFPEGPVAMDDGSVILVEIAAGKITRVKPDGKTQTIAKPGGGPNGLAIGPDGALYVCNNGEQFHLYETPGSHHSRSRAGNPHRRPIERVNISTGKVEALYGECDGERLIAPNDLVFDTSAGSGSPITARRRDESARMARSITRRPMVRRSRRCCAN